jgi:hypothetical protein
VETDTFVGFEGWTIDDVLVRVCRALTYLPSIIKAN